MSNTMKFHRSNLDLLVEAIPIEERMQIMLDFDELERTGKNGDTALRKHAGEIYRSLQGKPSGFDAAYMMFVGYSVHKIAAIEEMEARNDLDRTDDLSEARNALGRIAHQATTREIIMDRALAEGRRASTSEDLEKVISIWASRNERKLGHERTASADAMIMTARNALGIQTPDVSEDLARFPDLLSDLNPGNPSTWPIEQISADPPRFASVDHENRLLTPAYENQEKAEKHKTDYRGDEVALQSMRERYESEFPGPGSSVDRDDPEEDTPGF